jgi:hypothetical protein
MLSGRIRTPRQRTYRYSTALTVKQYTDRTVTQPARQHLVSNEAKQDFDFTKQNRTKDHTDDKQGKKQYQADNKSGINQNEFNLSHRTSHVLDDSEHRRTTRHNADVIVDL